MIREREFLLGLTSIVAQAFPARVDQNAIDCRDFTVNRCNFDKNSHFLWGKKDKVFYPAHSFVTGVNSTRTC